ncbi:hypothetical protein RND81_13G127500 [Saponaria officinalis]|uniref:Uncharacterized protein n=1 Tax=Saponaria officinalis TaxID=3572 RepID=A0AAW1H0D6_SAPOF
MAATPPSTEQTTATSTTSDGPVLSVITKRLRALRKMLNRIHQMEDSLSHGKTQNSEQLDVLRSKPAVVTLIDELEKLRAPLSAAVEEELSLALATIHEPRESSKTVEEIDNDVVIGIENSDGNNDDRSSNVVEDLVKLMYFGSLFDVKLVQDLLRPLKEV